MFPFQRPFMEALLNALFWITQASIKIKLPTFLPKYPLSLKAGITWKYHELILFIFSAYPLNEIPAKTRQGAAIIHMILNNLDPKVAQFPQELVTYGGNGQVFSNWAQVTFHIILASHEKMALKNVIFFSARSSG